MKILFLGDIVGDTGFKAVKNNLSFQHSQYITHIQINTPPRNAYANHPYDKQLL